MKEGVGRERGKKGMGNGIFSLCVGKKGRVRIRRNERREMGECDGRDEGKR